MSAQGRTGKMTSGEKATARLLRLAPWLAFLIVSLPLPLIFLLQYFTANEDAAVYMLLALTSLAGGLVVGLIVALLFLLYRKRWEKRLRNRLAADGVTADELSWFTSELTPPERRSLKAMEAQNPLLADAYRETLAARVTAARVMAHTRRESVVVSRRLQEASRLQGGKRQELERDLQSDRARLERVEREVSEHHAEVQTRLKMIEAMASRGASEAETEQALMRLGTVSAHVPLGLVSAQMDREAREQTQKELREMERSESSPG
jgi:hypothetical protein